jgi:hypothetical protein
MCHLRDERDARITHSDSHLDRLERRLVEYDVPRIAPYHHASLLHFLQNYILIPITIYDLRSHREQ